MTSISLSALIICDLHSRINGPTMAVWYDAAVDFAWGNILHRRFTAMGTLSAALVICGTACRTAPVTVPIVLSSAIELGPRRSIAVAGLRGWKDRSSSELLEQALAATGRFAIVERARVDGAIRSLQLSTLEPEGAAKLGALLGADAVVSGFIEPEY